MSAPLQGRSSRMPKFLPFGGAGPLEIPERVRAAIERQQAQSEILIGWVQLGVVGVFGTLYALSPKTFHTDVMITPVPWALTAYLVFTVIRLLLAYRNALARWFLTLSVIVDMTLLMGLIWSFHVQYEQPAAFVLKIPTLLYVFIFIALRALRFDAFFVLLAGVTASVGWLFVVGLSVIEGTSEITRDFVLYMTSTRILPGAEFDKIASILVVTAILALAIVRARRLLVRSVTESAAAEDLSRFFSPEVADQITRSEHRIEPGQGELVDAAVLFCDIRGFTRLSLELTPDALMALLAEYETRVGNTIQNHGGSIDKYLGDGIMATFGAASRSETWAADALNAVDELVAMTEAWREERRAAGERPLEIGFAVATGPVVFGAVGDPKRLEYTVIGNAVNLAAKLEKHNKVAGAAALTTEWAYEEAHSQGYEPPRRRPVLEKAEVVGVEQPINLIVLAP